MWQEIIVYIFVFLAVCGAVYYTVKKLRALRKNSSCKVCVECPLKEQCSKTIGKRSKCKGSVPTSSGCGC